MKLGQGGLHLRHLKCKFDELIGELLKCFKFGSLVHRQSYARAIRDAGQF